ncbi:hypothetical protein PQC39_gp052 [Vibrio phage Vp_R1]|uniref:Uncharacterized protein n=1 Tax=Vibrio phage Vp_R1 TaxID=2059867 RepID=A0A2H5BQI9_9CAUD|nr:hypothetical protein PQC39_gp052 [Vibrio phage Vp_R1]AUG88416.1 hypothetical protein VPR_052 [Vibrio phage Vp_R1]
MLAVKEDIDKRIEALEEEIANLDYKGCEHCGHLSEEQISAFTKKGELENLIREYNGVLDVLED